MKRLIPFLIIVVVLIAAVLGAWMFMRSSRPAPNANTNANNASPGTEPTGAEPPHVRGNANAPVTVEEFADFQCGTCGFYYPELKKIEAEFGDNLRVIFR